MYKVVFAEVTETEEIPGAWAGGALSLRLVRAVTDDGRRLGFVLVAGEGLGYTDTMVPCRLDGSREFDRLVDCHTDILEGLHSRRGWTRDHEATYVRPLGNRAGLFPWTKSIVRSLFRALREEAALRQLEDLGSELARALALTPEEERLLAEREKMVPRENVKAKSVAERIISLLCERGEVRMTKAELAREVGCVEKTADRVLSELRQAGVVEVQENRAPTGANLANTYALATSTPESVDEVTCCLSSGPMPMQKIASACGLPVHTVRAVLRLMQHNGEVELIRARKGRHVSQPKDLYVLTVR